MERTMIESNDKFQRMVKLANADGVAIKARVTDKQTGDLLGFIVQGKANSEYRVEVKDSTLVCNCRAGELGNYRKHRAICTQGEMERAAAEKAAGYLAKQEQQIIDAMRQAIATYHDRSAKTHHPYRDAHDLFGEHMLEWSEEFAAFYNRMLEIWRMYTPSPTGRIKRTHKEIGYTPWQTGRFIADKVQPAIPTDDELLSLFDAEVTRYQHQAHGAAYDNRIYREERDEYQRQEFERQEQECKEMERENALPIRRDTGPRMYRDEAPRPQAVTAVALEERVTEW